MALQILQQLGELEQDFGVCLWLKGFTSKRRLLTLSDYVNPLSVC